MFRKVLILLVLSGFVISGLGACKKKEATPEPEGTAQKQEAEVKGTATPETPPPLPPSPPPSAGSAPATGEGSAAPTAPSTPPPPPPPPPAQN